MAIPRLGGSGIGLSLSNALGSLVPTPAGVFVAPAQGNNAVTLAAGQVLTIPAGVFMAIPGPYSSLQWLDPVSTMWRSINGENGIQPRLLDSDGSNFRLANLTGCAVGALITNAGTGYSNGVGSAATGLAIAPSAGGSTWVPVVGGAINSTIAITAAGANYLFPPIVVIAAPPSGGIQATASCTISGGAVNAVTVLNQGAGYRIAPLITLLNDARDSNGAGASLTVNATLVGSGSLTAMYPSNVGNPLTAVPTFTFSPASTTAATAIMNFVVTGLTVTGGGVAVPAGSSGEVTPVLVAGTRAANTAGPINDFALTQPRPAWLSLNISGGVIQGSGNVVADAGFGFQAVPAFALQSSTGVAPTTGVNITPTVGGIVDTSYLQPM